MPKRNKLLAVFSILSMVVTLAMGLGGSVPVSAAITPEGRLPPSSVITYNLYATDGWWTMADGLPIYSYGYIGGRSDQPMRWLDKDGNLFKLVSGVPTPANPTDTDGDPTPAPTSGGITGPEAAFQGNAQFPAPMITAAVGDTVIIKLKNLGVVNPLGFAQNNQDYPFAPNDPHSVHLHGLDVDVANDGVPETSVAAIPANDTGLTGYGNVIVYMFSTKTEGTYFYHCHQEADIHVTMGMYGALLIYNKGEAGATNGPGKKGTLFGFKYDKDYVLMLSDTDVRQHFSEAGMPPDPNFGYTGDFNPVDFKPQYWFINALSFPNTIHAGLPGFNWANWKAAHPGYDPLITGSVGKKEKVLVRICNMGFEAAPMHSHGYHPQVLGSDQRAWRWASNPANGFGMEKNTLLIGSGEEYDLLFDMKQQAVFSNYQAGTDSRYDEASGLPQLNAATQFPAIKEAGDPVAQNSYIGGPPVSGAVGIPGSSQIFVYHNHDDYKATNNGVYPGGMFTIIVPTP